MTVENTVAIRQRFANDSHRPQYHYLPPSNWMNDPNGVIQWQNRYHLFYQYNPEGAYHDNMHWGHAVSDDLIHWDDLPIAIAPGPDSVDEGGIFSGCIVNHQNTPMMFYTGTNHDDSVQTQCLAIGNRNLLSWDKHPNNPIIGNLPPEMQQTGDFRDPFVWQEDGDLWYMLVGSRIEGVGGAVLLYCSENLVDWDYLNPLLVGDCARNGIMWECPNFFQLEDKWVLLISAHIGHTTGTVLYFVGEYKNHRFYPDVEGVLDSGYFYAPLTHLDNQGRRIMHAWIREGRSVAEQVSAGWSGVQTIPRELSLDSKQRLTMRPVPELEQLRSDHHSVNLSNVTENFLDIKGTSLEIKASFTISPKTQCGLVVAASSDGSEQTRILYDVDTQTLRVHRQYATENRELDSYWQGIWHPLDEDEILDLHILLDHSVLEIIANKRSSLTSRIYPQRADSQHIRVINPSSLNTLDIYDMSSIWSVETS